MAVSGQHHAPAALYFRERTPGTRCTGSWVGPIAGLATEARGKILSPQPRIESRSPSRPVCSQTLYTVFQKELYNFERVYNRYIQKTYTMF
jgi:hypothetical protein